MRFHLFIMLFLSFTISCSEEKYISYHDNGRVKFEVPLEGGEWNGIGKGYYPSGKLRGTASYIMGKRDGIAYEYFESGSLKSSHNFYNGKPIGEEKLYDNSKNLLEITFYDSMGNVIDFSRFLKNGERDYSFVAPIFRLSQDSVKLGTLTEFFVKIGNVDSLNYLTGTLVITSEFDNNNLPIDTLEFYSGMNRNGFHYHFTPKTKGENYIKGILFFQSVNKSDLLKSPYRFEFKYMVY